MSASVQWRPTISEKGGEGGGRNPVNGALFGLLQSLDNIPLISPLMCVSHHKAFCSGSSWENQIVNLYGLAELHMENCLAKERLSLSWQAELENISTWHLPPTLLWFILCFVCLFSWPMPLAGHLSSLVYDCSHNVWILSLTLVRFLDGALLWTTMPLKQHSYRDSDTAGSARIAATTTKKKQLATNGFFPLVSSFFPPYNFLLKMFV